MKTSLKEKLRCVAKYCDELNDYLLTILASVSGILLFLALALLTIMLLRGVPF